MMNSIQKFNIICSIHVLENHVKLSDNPIDRIFLCTDDTENFYNRFYISINFNNQRDNICTQNIIKIRSNLSRKRLFQR